jgi:hypothetical protein
MCVNYAKYIAIPLCELQHHDDSNLIDQLRQLFPGFIIAQIAEHLGIMVGPLAYTKAWGKIIPSCQQTVRDIRNLGAGLSASFCFYKVVAASRLQCDAQFLDPDRT